MRFAHLVRQTCLLCLTAGTAAMAWGQKAEVWSICLPDYAVLPYLTQPGESEGNAQRAIQDSARQIGLQLTVLWLAPAQCTAMLQRGEVQATIAGATEYNLKTLAFPQHAGLVDANKRLAHLRMIWLKSRQSHWDWSGMEFTKSSAQPLRMGTLARNQVTREVLGKLGARMDAAANTTEQLLAKVAAGQLDGAVMLQDEFALLRHTPDAGLVEVLPRPFAVVDYYLVFRRDTPSAARAIQEAWWSAIGTLRTLPAYQLP